MANFGNIEVDGFVEQQKALDRLMMSNPDVVKRVQGLIRDVLVDARKNLGEDAKQAMKSDPRNAYKAVKTAVYKRILGGNVSILSKRRATGGTSSYEPPRTLRPGQRGGNRVPRGERTQQLMGYDALDRGFILRWLNSGVNDRTIRFTQREGRKTDKWNKHPNTGNRGSIAPRNWFGQHAGQEMGKAAQKLTDLIGLMIQEEFNK